MPLVPAELPARSSSGMEKTPRNAGGSLSYRRASSQPRRVRRLRSRATRLAPLAREAPFRRGGVPRGLSFRRRSGRRHELARDVRVVVRRTRVLRLPGKTPADARRVGARGESRRRHTRRRRLSSRAEGGRLAFAMGGGARAPGSPRFGSVWEWTEDFDGRPCRVERAMLPLRTCFAELACAPPTPATTEDFSATRFEAASEPLMP